MPQDAGAFTAAPTRQLVTGNRLRDGIPVYFAGRGRWSPVIAEAVHVTGDAAEALLAEAQAGGPPHPVIAPYLIDAAVVDGWLRPLSLREQIRAFGPTVRSPNPEAV
jgi:sulfite reductase (NADPH) hemoprotein beta-component